MENRSLSIIGATGNLGVPVVKNLLAFGFKLKLIVRNIEKAHKLFGKSDAIQLVEADLNDVDALSAALAETEFLYLNLATYATKMHTAFEAEREGVANILRAVDRAKIKQIVAISGLGAFNNVYKPNSFEFIPNLIRKQGHKLIKESGIPYTILHCSWFADSFLVYQRNKMYSVIGDTKSPIYFTNCYNYSLHLANAINNSNAFYKEFPIQGNVGYAHPDAAKQFLDIVSPETKVARLPVWLVNVLAVFKKEMKFVKHMSDYAFASKEEFLAEDCDTYKILGEPELSLTEYAQKVKHEKLFDYLKA